MSAPCTPRLGSTRRARLARGFTLVEMLVVITIIGILVGLLMPAITTSRETARKLNCASNLRQLGTAVQSHLAAQQIFPTGGWGVRWVGDPDRGFRSKQPGGWIYNLLPYLDNDALHNQGASMDLATKQQAALKLIQTPLQIMHCPSFRRAVTYRLSTSNALLNAAPNAASMGAKSDYAINAGSQKMNSAPNYPSNSNPSWADTNFANQWRDLNSPFTTGTTPNPYYHTGVSYQRSEITVEDVRDGMTYTILAGEKFVDLDARTTTSAGNQYSMYAGYCEDNYRTTYYENPPLPPGQQFMKKTNVGPGRPPLRDESTSVVPPGAWGNDTAWSYSRFGGPHPGSCNIVFCDGSVHAISYTIDYAIFRCMGNRCDGMTYDMSTLEGGTGQWQGQ